VDKAYSAGLMGFSMFFDRITYSARTLDNWKKWVFMYILQMRGLGVLNGFEPKWSIKGVYKLISKVFGFLFQRIGVIW